MDFLYPELSYNLRGAFFNVYKQLGSIHKESIYQKALAQEFTNRKIAFQQEVALPVNFNGSKVGIYRADFIVDNKIIVETKATKFNLKEFENQLFHYLASSNYQLAFLVNFGTINKVYIKRWLLPK